VKITLTFDNGPHPEVTPQVLDILRAHDLRAYFFVVGQQVATYGIDLVSQAAAEGHRIGNHTFSHEVPLGLQPGGSAVAEVCLTHDLIADQTSQPRLFRPFGRRGAIGPHLFGAETWAHLEQGGYSIVLWNCLAYEWDDAHGWVDPTLDRCRAQPHSVVVLHDIPTGAIDHLDSFIRALKDEGADFTTEIPESCMPMRGGRTVWSASRMTDVLGLPPP
jgi:peptidoglycan/xylan/chitin deacetylase (PgdA/CDA1 family)